MNDVASLRSTRHLVVLLVVSLLVGALSCRAILDDGYIYLIVSRNIVAGEGWRFNMNGEVANPCTSPLYTLLLVALQRVAIPPIVATMALYSQSHRTKSLYLSLKRRCENSS